MIEGLTMLSKARCDQDFVTLQEESRHAEQQHLKAVAASNGHRQKQHWKWLVEQGCVIQTALQRRSSL
jgi:hypothetical protein